MAYSNRIKDPAIGVVTLSKEPRAGRVEAGVQNRKDQPTAGPQCPKYGPEHWGDGGHIHDGHIADSGIELSSTERGKLVRVCQVHEVVFDTIAVFDAPGSGALQKFRAEIAGEHARALLGHRSREEAVATCQIRHNLAGAQVKQPLHCRRDQAVVPVIPFAHTGIPPARVVIPDSLAFGR
jgi:hypothetical protein